MPRSVGDEAGIKSSSRVIVRVCEGRIELIPFDTLKEEVVRVTSRAFRGWREEEHEASKLLREIVSK